MINGPKRYIFYKKTMSKLPYGEVRRVHVALEAAPVHVAIAVEVAVDNTVELAKRVQRGGIAVPEAPIPSKHRHSTVTAPSHHRHSAHCSVHKKKHLQHNSATRSDAKQITRYVRRDGHTLRACGAMATASARRPESHPLPLTPNP